MAPEPEELLLAVVLPGRLALDPRVSLGKELASAFALIQVPGLLHG